MLIRMYGLEMEPIIDIQCDQAAAVVRFRCRRS